MMLDCKSYSRLLVVAGLTLAFQSCKKDKINNPPANADVYVAGNVGDTAVYWKNGMVVYLADSAAPLKLALEQKQRNGNTVAHPIVAQAKDF